MAISGIGWQCWVAGQGFLRGVGRRITRSLFSLRGQGGQYLGEWASGRGEGRLEGGKGDEVGERDGLCEAVERGALVSWDNIQPSYSAPPLHLDYGIKRALKVTERSTCIPSYSSTLLTRECGKSPPKRSPLCSGQAGIDLLIQRGSNTKQ